MSAGLTGSAARRRRRLHVVLRLAATLLVATSDRSVSYAQENTLESRLERFAGVKLDVAREFFTSLRRAVGTGDMSAVCAMVAYPLRQPGGDVADAAICQSRYDQIFTIPIRRAIGKQQFEELFVDAEGVMVGMGEVWFAPTCRGASCQRADLRVVRINAGDGLALTPPKGKILTSCIVAGQRLHVTADGTGGADLRLWREPAGTGAPAEQMLGGKQSTRGTAECAAPVWSFSNGTTSYVVTTVGCPDDADPPPMGSVAQVTRTTALASEQIYWCRE